MWLVWWALGLAVGGCVMYFVMAQDNTRRIRALLWELHDSLLTEEEYARAKGSTRKAIATLLDEGW